MLERFGHGGDWQTAQEIYGMTRETILDFSANMNPWGPPPAVERIIREQWRDIVRYPDPDVRRLRLKLAEYHSVPPESILVGNGAAELIELAVRLLLPGPIAVAQPSFTEYEEAALKADKPTLSIPLDKERQFQLDAHRLEAALTQAGSLVLGHPNNPNGQLLPAYALDRLREIRKPVLLDEAFIDFSDQEGEVSLLREAAASRYLIVLRSMTKFYAVPGIRLGYAVAHPETIQVMRRHQVPWSVNFLAQSIGEAVLDEQTYRHRTKQWLKEERAWLEQALTETGLTIYPGTTNFILFEIPATSRWTAVRLQQALGQRRILVRNAALFPGLNDRFIWVAVRLRQDNERLIEVLKEVMAG